MGGSKDFYAVLELVQKFCPAASELSSTIKESSHIRYGNFPPVYNVRCTVLYLVISCKYPELSSSLSSRSLFPPSLPSLSTLPLYPPSLPFLPASFSHFSSSSYSPSPVLSFPSYLSCHSSYIPLLPTCTSLAPSLPFTYVPYIFLQVLSVEKDTYCLPDEVKVSLDFEISNYLCSGVKIHSVKLDNSANVKKWIRHISTASSCQLDVRVI